MSEETRWFVKAKTAVGQSFQVVHVQGSSLVWPRDLGEIVYQKEIPKDFWGYTLNEYIDFFEHNKKPRLRIGGSNDVSV